LTACLNAFMSLTARMSEGRAFHAEGPVCEKERSPNLDGSWGRTKLKEDVEQSRERQQAAVTVRTMSVKYAGQLPSKTECIMQHSLNWIRQWTTASDYNYSWLCSYVSRSPSVCWIRSEETTTTLRLIRSLKATYRLYPVVRYCI